MKQALTKSTRKAETSDAVLTRLVKAPEHNHQIYEIAESLFMRDPNVRMSLADIERVNKYLRQTENDVDAVKKQLRELALIEEVFRGEAVPLGF